MTRKSWRKDYTGQVFNQLTAVRFVELRGKWQQIIWLWLCGCGVEKEISAWSVVAGRTKSCGCLQKRVAKELCESRFLGESVAAINTLYGRYKASAKRKLRVFSLSREDFESIIRSNCKYCGCLPSQPYSATRKSLIIYNGIDRVDTSLGYILSNCVACCINCNRAKSTMSVKQFGEWVRDVSKNLNNWYDAK